MLFDCGRYALISAEEEDAEEGVGEIAVAQVPEELIEKVFVVVILRAAQRTAGDIAHRVQSVRGELFGIPPAHAPEIGKQAVTP